ncbi:lysozyme family protein [Aeromonas simiae]|uniref:hypothetical protein n=1 Tax=Aeromonas simiae TaxID=218936 RepID=UPI000694F8C7|nr:hypothetical protein [Aeromonas simiae]
MLEDYLTSTFQGESLRYSNCFCLVEHEYCEINPETQATNEFTFYSLYMHLLPWRHYQSGETLVLKKGWNARNSVPHANPDVEQRSADAALPKITLPAGTELALCSGGQTKRGSVGGKEYDFVRVTIKSALPAALQQKGEQAGVVIGQGCEVWIANSPEAVECIKPQKPSWLYDQIEAELTQDMMGRADPTMSPARQWMAGKKCVSLPAGTRVTYDAHRLEFHWIGNEARKMARCSYITPAGDDAPSLRGVAWVCVEDRFIKVVDKAPTQLGQLYVLPKPVAISAGETIGYLGLVETPGSLMGGKQSKHQVHLEVFTQDPRLDDVLANKAKTVGGTRYAKVPADLLLHEKQTQDGKTQWVATQAKSQTALVESPQIEKDSAQLEWVGIGAGKYVKKAEVELLSQHDWLKIGFKKVDGSGSDGYLDPDAPPSFFNDLVNSFDTNKDGKLSSAEIRAALRNPKHKEQLQKLIVKHPSEWYEKSSSTAYTWLDKLKVALGLPEFDQLVDHEKQRIDKLEWMQSATKLNLMSTVCNFYPGWFFELAIPSVSDDEMDLRWLTVPKGQLTFDAEGNDVDTSIYFSRIPHIPMYKDGSVIGQSGITYGRGLDVGQQTEGFISSLLTSVGEQAMPLSDNMSLWLIGAAGKKRNLAKEHLKLVNEHVPEKEQVLTRKQQHFLFLSIYSNRESTTKRTMEGARGSREILAPIGKIVWEKLPINVQEVLVDLTFRGDNHSKSRDYIIPSLVDCLESNDYSAFKNLMKNRKVWIDIFNVPRERFNARASWIK